MPRRIPVRLPSFGARLPLPSGRLGGLARLSGIEFSLPLPNPLDVVRARDLAVLRLRFVNLELVTGPTRLVRTDPDAPAFVLAELPPQALAEPVIWLKSDASLDEDGPPELPVDADGLPDMRLVAAGPTRLAFRIPPDVPSIPWTLPDLLVWASWEPVVSPYARSNGRSIGPPTEPPPADVTAVELPFRLLLSGDVHARWRARAEPFAPAGRTELWHATLAAPGDEQHLRAVWARKGRDSDSSVLGVPVLTDSDRYDLVVRTTGPDDAAPTPVYGPVSAEHLMVSALGGWLDVEGAWNPEPAGVAGVISWRHAATLGRDQEVRVATLGRLLPFGHRAMLVETAKRATAGTAKMRAAWLFGETRLVVIEAVRRFPFAGSPAGTAVDRRFPFRRVRLVTTSTPAVKLVGGWPMVGPGHLPLVDLPFEVTATDASGRVVTLSMPMRFVEDKERAVTAAAAYQNDPRSSSVMARSQELMLIDPDVEAAAPPVYPVESLSFGVVAVEDPTKPPRPVLREFLLHLPAAARLTGSVGARRAAYADDWVDYTGDTLVLLDKPQAIDFSTGTDRVGALAAPSYVVNGVTRSAGLVPGVRDDGLSFDPATALGDSRLLGGLRLADLVAAGTAPPLLVDVLEGGVRRTQLQWTAALVSVGVLAAGSGAQLRLDVDLPDPGSDATPRVEAALTGISFDFDVIAVDIALLRYTAVAGSAPTVMAALADPPVRFAGALRFLDRLRQLLPADGFANPPAVTVDPTGIRADYDLALPDVALGAFAIKELTLSAGLGVPFTGEPARVRFALASRDAPFRVAVSAFTGGGSVAVSVGLDGVQALEASLDFGASVELNVGVASGGVTVVGGLAIDFTESSPGGPGSVQLTAFIRATGTMRFLHLVSLSIEMYIALAYREQTSGATSVWGIAKYTVEVEVAFFSKSVSFTVDREFAGSSPDPDVHESISEAEFLAYAAAFADD